jgi:hypothetical protein
MGWFRGVLEKNKSRPKVRTKITAIDTPNRPANGFEAGAGGGLGDGTGGQGWAGAGGLGVSIGGGSGAGGIASATLGGSHTGGGTAAGPSFLGSAALKTCAHIGQRTALPATPKGSLRTRLHSGHGNEGFMTASHTYRCRTIHCTWG